MKGIRPGQRHLRDAPAPVLELLPHVVVLCRLLYGMYGTRCDGRVNFYTWFRWPQEAFQHSRLESSVRREARIRQPRICNMGISRAVSVRLGLRHCPLQMPASVHNHKACKAVPMSRHQVLNKKMPSLNSSAMGFVRPWPATATAASDLVLVALKKLVARWSLVPFKPSLPPAPPSNRARLAFCRQPRP